MKQEITRKLQQTSSRLEVVIPFISVHAKGFYLEKSIDSEGVKYATLIDSLLVKLLVTLSGLIWQSSCNCTFQGRLGGNQYSINVDSQPALK